MRATQAAAALALASGVSAFWRMPCRSRTGLARLDPLMDPGEISDHVHSIFGGGNFGMDTTYEDLAQTSGALNCTSCGVIEDQSAYWTPALYWQADDGTTEIVQQVGGMLAYYLFYLDNVKAFPEGFRMLAGNRNDRHFNGSVPDAPLSEWPTVPDDQYFLQQRALGFNCLNYDKDPEPSLYRHQMPERDYLDANCKDGIRLELAFPSCSNGELDSDDHMSHMAYPSLVKEGNCPEGYDTHYPFLFYESIFATNLYAGKGGQFVLSHGDPTGCGYHGDFIMGWKSEEYLQNAINTCTSSSGQVEDCEPFTLQDDSDAALCTFPVPDALKDDDNEGPCAALPVDVPVQYGPESATLYPVVGRNGASTAKSSSAQSTKPSTSYKLPELTYSAANPSITATAPGGIVVAKYSSGAASDDAAYTEAASTEAASSTITSTPSLSDASSAIVVATSYITQGNDVVALVIEEVNVTVTAAAAPTAAAKRRRHVQHHIHKNAVHY